MFLKRSILIVSGFITLLSSPVVGYGATSGSSHTAIAQSSKAVSAKSITPISGKQQCSDDVAAGKSNRRRSSPSSACLMTAEQARRRVRSNSALLVDVRKADSYRAGSLPNAINIPLFAVKTKTILKDKHLILFDDGSDTRALVSECKELVRKYGMKISVLEGGIPKWSAEEQAKNIVYPLPLAKFLASDDSERWLVIDVSGRTELSAVFNKSKIVRVKNKFSSANEKAIGTGKTHKDLLVLTDNGVLPKQWTQIHKKIDQPVYLLEGGINGYLAHRQNRSAFLARMERGPVKVVQCVK